MAAILSTASGPLAVREVLAAARADGRGRRRAGTLDWPTQARGDGFAPSSRPGTAQRHATSRPPDGGTAAATGSSRRSPTRCAIRLLDGAEGWVAMLGRRRRDRLTRPVRVAAPAARRSRAAHGARLRRRADGRAAARPARARPSSSCRSRRSPREAGPPVDAMRRAGLLRGQTCSVRGARAADAGSLTRPLARRRRASARPRARRLDGPPTSRPWRRAGGVVRERCSRARPEAFQSGTLVVPFDVRGRRGPGRQGRPTSRPCRALPEPPGSSPATPTSTRT